MAQKKDFLERQVGSRGMYFISAVIVGLVRAGFAVVGGIAGVLSMIYPYSVLVKAAFEGMAVGLILRDIGFCAVKFCSPRNPIFLPLEDPVFRTEASSSEDVNKNIFGGRGPVSLE